MQKLISLIAVFMLLALPAHAQGMPQAGFADLVEKLSPAVVNISTTQKIKNPPVMFGAPFQEFPNTPEFEPFRDFFERFGQGMKQAPEREVTSLGSGFVIDAKGYVITNNHVIDQADDITVTFPNNDKYKAKLIGKDKKTDLALLKIEAGKDFPFVAMGDSDIMRVGDAVIAIGNPFGLGGTVTQGIISARQRSINAGPFDDFLQTDAPINRGNSGGPLFNIKGEVIGINSAIFSPSGGSVGIGFAIPTALAKPVIEQLKASGHVTRGWLGVKIQEVSEEVADSVGLSKPIGALVLEVSKDSPAAKAGLVSGDIITQYDGKDIAEMRHLPRMVAETKIGKSVPMTYWRDGTSKSATVTIVAFDEGKEQAMDEAKPAPKDKSAKGENFIGMTVANLTPALRSQLQLEDSVNGLVVVDVDAGGEAAKRGIREGDVIVGVGGGAIKDFEGLKKAFESAKKAGRKYALLRIVRRNEEAFVTLPVRE